MFNPDTDLPKVGDVVNYSRNGLQSVTLPVTQVEHREGFTDCWLGDGLIREPLFSINHTGGLAHRGEWHIVSRNRTDTESKSAAGLAEFGDTVTEEEQDFSAELYDLLSDHFTIPFFGRGRVIQAAIEAVRKETR